MPLTDKTAILFFAADPASDEKGRRFPRSKAGVFRRSFSGLHQRTLTILKKTGLPIFLSNERNQYGNDFGARITHAVQTVFLAGYDSVIIAGNDCPALNISHLRQTWRGLQNGANVLGPATDGGAYLIGLQRSSFFSSDWTGLPWQTGRLYEALRQLLLETGAPFIALAPQADIDHPGDLFQWFLRPAGRKLPGFVEQWLKALLSVRQHFNTAFKPVFTAFLLALCIGLRGPPMFVPTGH